jgi:trehalose-6-phosphate synthase
LLSQTSGAAEQLRQAIRINPCKYCVSWFVGSSMYARVTYGCRCGVGTDDSVGMCEALVQALTMSDSEQRARMRALRHIVRAIDVNRWARSFIDSVHDASLSLSMATGAFFPYFSLLTK